MGILSLSRISVLGVRPPWMVLSRCWDLEFLLDGLGLRLDCLRTGTCTHARASGVVLDVFSLGVDWSLWFDLVLP